MNITDFIAATGNKFASIADEGIVAGDVAGFVDSGSYTLNALLSGSIYGGFPGNKITVISSESGAGKTFLSLGAAKLFQDREPEGIVIYFESESAVSKEMMQSRGLDLRRTGVVPVSTVQEFKTQCLKLIDTYEKTPEKERKPLFLVLDSLGMLSTTKEMEDSLQGVETKDMTRPGQIKSAFRTLTLRLGKAQVPLIVTNHVYANIGSLYGGPTAGGGSGPVYSGSTCLSLTKAQDKNSDNEVVGAIVTVTVTKGRLTREKSKAKCMIRHDSGLDRYYGLLELAEDAEIFKKVSTRYELPDGKKVFGKAINDSPEEYFTQEILDQIDKYVGKKFLYGGGGDTSEKECEQNHVDE